MHHSLDVAKLRSADSFVSRSRVEPIDVDLVLPAPQWIRKVPVVFTKHIPRTGSNEVSSRSAVKTISGIATMLALGASFALAGPVAANAADVPHSYAEGQFLSGSIGGTNLANVI